MRVPPYTHHNGEVDIKRLPALSILIIFALCTGASAGQTIKTNPYPTKKNNHAPSSIGPDVTRTPTFTPTPTPYPSIKGTGKSVKKSKSKSKLKVIEGTNHGISAGDEAGTLKGLATTTNMGIVKPKFGTSKVKVDGKNVTRQGDAMFSNKKNIAK